MTDLVDEHRTAVAARFLVRPEHEVVEEQLPPPLEEVEQARLAVRPVEDVILVHADHRQPATLGGERVACPSGFFFVGKKRVPRCLPLRRGDDRGKVHERSHLHRRRATRLRQSGNARRRHGDRKSENDQGDCEHWCEPRPARQDLFRKDRHGDHRHPEEAHHTEDEQHRHQGAGTADAVEAVRETAPQSAPAVWCAAAATEAEPLQRRQLVDPRGDDHATRDVRAASVPREPAQVERGHEPEEGVGHDAVSRPDRQVPGREEHRRQTACDARDVSRSRRRRRQHHRGGHRHPDSEVPPEPAEVGARARVHPAHPIDRDCPGNDRAGDQHDRRSAASHEVLRHPGLLPGAHHV